MQLAPLFLTLLSAALYSLSFPPASLSLFIWVALVPFFFVASMVQPLQAAMYGVLWGLAMTCGVAWCLPTMVANYFDLPLVVGLINLLAAGIGLSGIYYGAFAAWLSWLARQRPVGLLTIVAGWGACEFARANMFLGTPWALSGYSQVTFTRLMQIADATGPYGVGWLIAAVNAGLASFFVPALRSKRPMLSLAGAFSVCGLALIYGEWRLSQTFVAGDPIKIGVVQAAIERQFRNPEHRRENLQRYLDLTQKAATTASDIIFWPEYALDFYLQEDSPESAAVLELTERLEANLILGGSYYHGSKPDWRFYDSVFLVWNGNVADRYDKLHLIPFGEEGHLRWFLPSNSLRYTPGDKVTLLQTQVGPFGIFICFEGMYPDWVRPFAIEGAQVLANLSNDDWFGYAAPALHQLHIASVRAIENRRYLIRSTTTGFSAVIDPYGRVITQSNFGSPGILTATIFPARERTLYQQGGNVGAWIAGLGIILSLRHVGGLYKNKGREEA